MVEAVAAVAAAPFVKKEKGATRKRARAKVFVWGAPGAGKTCFGLSWPGVAVLDLERGTEAWEDQYEFSAFKPANRGELYEAVEWLRTNKHEFHTVVVDPFTVYCETVQKARSDRKLADAAHEEFEMADFEFRDWGSVGNEIKQFLNALVALDLNVILIAREKAKYAKTDKGLQEVGRTWDGHKAVEGWADTIIQLGRLANPDGTSQFRVNVKKDRGNKLGVASFTASSPAEIYDRFQKGFGIEALTADHTPRDDAPAPMTSTTEASVAATVEQIDELKRLIVELDLKPEKVENSLRKYGVSSLEKFSRAAAESVLMTLRANLSKKNEGQATNGSQIVG